jgi:hypothetical protein
MAIFQFPRSRQFSVVQPNSAFAPMKRRQKDLQRPSVGILRGRLRPGQGKNQAATQFPNAQRNSGQNAKCVAKPCHTHFVKRIKRIKRILARCTESGHEMLIL